ncbi:DUF3040 domain-containing protein [Streptomyces albipurpureus]|uniref:DUF3040 domain-containing protein n=1 Tax=Streptomyces albipurpureus TaxID=2897419 RepID=A0ABT0UPN0_9ACTN|nr:DUF3040 domain-containing protein [Streptomyces sp. CWNU-1]MCM2390498.1 DUF3040 domain-containing protein [Streptomyces sp. CWNU-1]
MARSGNDPLHDLAHRMRNDDPRFARAMERGQPRRPREYRRRSAWLLLSVAVVLFGVGMGIADGLLIASGVVAAGAAGHLFDPQLDRPGQQSRR